MNACLEAGSGRIEQMVGATGFEPATSSSRTKRATKLRHAPTVAAEYTASASSLKRKRAAFGRAFDGFASFSGLERACLP